MTNAVTASGAPAIANSIGIPSGKQFSCIEQTDFCSIICYAGKLEKVYKGVSNVLLHNWELLKDADLETMTALLNQMIEEFVRDCEKRGAAPKFRIHWDGDFFSPVYVSAWRAVIKSHPGVQFWVYTRVATAALFLHAQKFDNLALYFSGDRDNLETARVMADKGIRVAYVGDTFEEGKKKFPGAVRCPENNGSIPLITPEGSACIRCGLCIRGQRDVLFSVKKG